MRLWMTALLLSLAAGNIFAGSTVPSSTTDQQPGLVLILSGGGARGAAHIGVLKVLEEMHIAPDMIVGTSMGSIVGGLYAAGWSPDEIEKLLNTIDWNRVFTDKVPRKDLSFRRKQDDRPFLIKARLHLDEKGFYLPGGLINGQSLDTLLQLLEARSDTAADFDRLPIPYRAVAMDIKTGKAVVIDSGRLSAAMRASMSIPGMFPPVQRNGQTLVDGGSAANLPVGIARSLGARRIIAVDISSPLVSPDLKLKNFWDIYNRLNSLLIVNNRDVDVERLTPKDIYIRPDLGEIGFLDFNRASETVDIGEKTAREFRDRLRNFVSDEQKWKAFMKKQRHPPKTTLHVDRIQLTDDSTINPSVARHTMKIAVPADLKPTELSEAILRVFNLRHSGIVSFEILEEAGENVLLIDAPKPPYGRNSFQLGLGLFDDFEGNGEYALTIRHQMLPTNHLDGEWVNILQLGSNSVFLSEYYQPLGGDLLWFIEPSIRISRQKQDFWLDGEPFVTYRYDREEFRLGGGRILGNSNEIRFSAFYSYNTFTRKVGLPVFPNGKESQGGLRLSFYHDSENSVVFPTSGSRIWLGLMETFEELGSDSENMRFYLNATTALSAGAYTFRPHFEYGENRDPTTLYEDLFFLGGLGRLSGLGNNELYGEKMALGRIEIYRRIKALDMAGIRIRFYAGDQSVDLDSFMYGGTIYLGAETPIGPLYLGYGLTEGGRDRWYLAIGDHF